MRRKTIAWFLARNHPSFITSHWVSLTSSNRFWIFSFFGWCFGNIHLCMRIWSEILAMTQPTKLPHMTLDVGVHWNSSEFTWFQGAYWTLILLWWEGVYSALRVRWKIENIIRTQLKDAKLMLSPVLECNSLTCCTSGSFIQNCMISFAELRSDYNRWSGKSGLKASKCREKADVHWKSLEFPQTTVTGNLIDILKALTVKHINGHWTEKLPKTGDSKSTVKNHRVSIEKLNSAMNRAPSVIIYWITY